MSVQRSPSVRRRSASATRSANGSSITGGAGTLRVTAFLAMSADAGRRLRCWASVDALVPTCPRARPVRLRRWRAAWAPVVVGGGACVSRAHAWQRSITRSGFHVSGYTYHRCRGG